MASIWTLIGALLGAGLVACMFALTSLMNDVLPEPYMDEVFHVPQAQAYCEHEFEVWDPKITTLPGIYVLAAALHPLTMCGVSGLRLSNSVLALGTLGVTYGLLRSLWWRVRGRRALLVLYTVCIGAMPVHLFFHSMFYTDTASTLCVLVCLWLVLVDRPHAAGLVGALSVVMRQTNVVWVACALGVGVVRTLRPIVDPEGSLRRGSVVSELLGYAWAGLGRAPQLLARFVILESVLVAFVVFVVVNEGIVVGDRDAHQSMAHGAMPLYFVAFTGVFACERWLEMLVKGNLRVGWWDVAAMVSVFGAALALVHWGTYAHPYLLADNRHVPFYLWKNGFRRWWWFRYALCPGYAVALWLMAKSIARRVRMEACVWVIATTLVLVPTPLLEFRYFIVPFIVYRILSGPPVSPVCALLGMLRDATLHALLVRTFLFRPWQWESGEVAHFMW